MTRSYGRSPISKNNDIQFYTLNWIATQANQAINPLNGNENIFKPVPQNQQPSPYFEAIYNQYNQASAVYSQNPNEENKITLDAAKSILNDKYIHSEDWNAPWNYNIGSGRGVFYPNDQLPQLKN